VKTPCLTQSPVPYLPPLTFPCIPLPHHPCFAFPIGTNTECGAPLFSFSGQNPLPRSISGSPPPTTTTSLPIGHPNTPHFAFLTGTNTKHRAPLFGFAGQNLLLCSISSSLPPTTNFSSHTSSHRAFPPPLLCTSNRD
jgi:hypothetical protein